MKKNLFIVLMTLVTALQSFATGTGQVGSVTANTFPNTSWQGSDSDQDLQITLTVDANNRWTANVVKNGKASTLTGSIVEVTTLFAGSEQSLDNPLVVNFKTDDGSQVFPPLAIIVNKAGKVKKLSYDTLSLKLR